MLSVPVRAKPGMHDERLRQTQRSMKTPAIYHNNATYQQQQTSGGTTAATAWRRRSVMIMYLPRKQHTCSCLCARAKQTCCAASFCYDLIVWASFSHNVSWLFLSGLGCCSRYQTLCFSTFVLLYFMLSSFLFGQPFPYFGLWHCHVHATMPQGGPAKVRVLHVASFAAEASSLKQKLMLELRNETLLQC